MRKLVIAISIISSENHHIPPHSSSGHRPPKLRQARQSCDIHILHVPTTLTRQLLSSLQTYSHCITHCLPPTAIWVRRLFSYIRGFSSSANLLISGAIPLRNFGHNRLRHPLSNFGLPYDAYRWHHTPVKNSYLGYSRASRRHRPFCECIPLPARAKTSIHLFPLDAFTKLVYIVLHRSARANGGRGDRGAPKKTCNPIKPYCSTYSLNYSSFCGILLNLGSYSQIG